MKKIMLLILLVITMSMLVSCGGFHFGGVSPLPEGVWQSETPNVILFLSPDYRIRRPTGYGGYFGLMFVDGTERILSVRFSAREDALRINDVTDRDFDASFNFGPPLFNGSIRVNDDELHLSLSPSTQERTGYDTIIFNRVKDYDPINVDDWFHPSEPKPLR